jgi:hypothetical protein
VTFCREHHIGSVKVPIHTIHKHHYKKVPEYKIVKVEKVVEVKGENHILPAHKAIG